MKIRTDDREQLLSAYLDGRFSSGQNERVVAWLDEDAAARNDLRALTYTRQLLAETSRVPVPRAFTLNEAMVGVRSPQRAGWLAWLQPAHLRLAAALVAVLLLVVLAGDLGIGWQTAGGEQSSALVAPSGGLAPDQGDPTGILAAKTATTEEAAQSPATFLGQSPAAVLALEASLVVLLLVLLAASWRMTRT